MRLGDRICRIIILFAFVYIGTHVLVAGVKGNLFPEQPPRYKERISVSASMLEDDPRWDCTWMGNRWCGPTT